VAGGGHLWCARACSATPIVFLPVAVGQLTSLAAVVDRRDDGVDGNGRRTASSATSTLTRSQRTRAGSTAARCA
jgi:hypothetical protein